MYVAGDLGYARKISMNSKIGSNAEHQTKAYSDVWLIFVSEFGTKFNDSLSNIFKISILIVSIIFI